MKNKFYIESIFLFLIGAITSLSLPPFNFFLINFFTFSLYFVFLVKKSKLYINGKLSFFYGWFFGFGYFVTNLYWISISLSFDSSFKFLIPISIIIIPMFLGIFYGLISYFFLLLKPKSIVSSFLLFSLLFGIFEFLRGSILSGFPWNLIAYSFSNQLEILSITSIIGTYGFNLFCISLFTCPAIILLNKKKKSIGVFIFFFLVTATFYNHGFNEKNKFLNSKKENLNYEIRAIGSNISLDRFYSNDDPVSVINELIEISEPTKSQKVIFVWPEGIIPNASQNDLIEYRWLFDEKFSKNHVLLMGINNEKDVNGFTKYYNSLSIYDHKLNLINSYNKLQLVPFGEFLPLENFFGSIGFKSITNKYQSYTRGNKREIIRLELKMFSVKFLPLICYEVIYSGKLFDKPDFDLIINISEDGWFGQSIGPKQHFVHSIFRAIESGKYLIRSSNNGITAIINPMGIIEQQLFLGETGYVQLNGVRKIQPTIFSKYGNKIFGLLILLYIFLIFSFNKTKDEQS